MRMYENLSSIFSLKSEMELLEKLKQKVEQFNKWATATPFVNEIHNAKHRINSFSFVIPSGDMIHSEEEAQHFFKVVRDYASKEYGFTEGEIEITSKPFGWDPMLHTFTVSRKTVDENLFLGHTTFFPLHQRQNEALQNVMKKYAN